MSQNPLHSFPSSPFGFLGRDLKMIYEKESEKQYTQHLITAKYESRKFSEMTQSTFHFLNCKCCNRRLYLIKSKDYFSKVKNVFSFFGLLDVIFITF